MRYFKNDAGEVYAFEADGSQDEFIKKGLVEITKAQADAIRNPPKTLAEVKTDKLAEIKAAYLDAADAPVEALGFTWDGGFDSAIKLDAARRLSEAAGALGVVFYDASNLAHPLSFDDALQVCIAVASVYQNTLSNKQGLYADVEAIKVSATMTEAQAIAAVQAIVW